MKFGHIELLVSDSFEDSAFNVVLYTKNVNETKTRLESKGVNFRGENGGCPIFPDGDGNWFQLVDPEGR